MEESREPVTEAPTKDTEPVEVVEVPEVTVTITFSPHAYDGMTDYAAETEFRKRWNEESRAMRRQVWEEIQKLRSRV